MSSNQEENVNITTDNIINHSNNRTNNDIGFNDKFDGNVNNVNVNINNSTAFSSSLDINDIDRDTEDVSLHSKKSGHQSFDSLNNTITKQVNDLFKMFGTINNMYEAELFHNNAAPLLDDLEYLIKLQQDTHKKNIAALNFEVNNRSSQGLLARFIKTNTEKGIIEAIEKIKNTIVHYKQLIKRINTHLKKYPSNDEEKQEIIQLIQLDIKELELKQKEIASKLKIGQAKAEHIKAHTSPSGSGSKKSGGIGGQGAMLDLESFGETIDDFLRGLFEGTMSATKAAEASQANTKEMLANEKKYAEIDEKIIALERKILSWERFR